MRQTHCAGWQVERVVTRDHTHQRWKHRIIIEGAGGVHVHAVHPLAECGGNKASSCSWAWRGRLQQPSAAAASCIGHVASGTGGLYQDAAVPVQACFKWLHSGSLLQPQQATAAPSPPAGGCSVLGTAAEGAICTSEIVRLGML